MKMITTPVNSGETLGRQTFSPSSRSVRVVDLCQVRVLKEETSKPAYYKNEGLLVPDRRLQMPGSFDTTDGSKQSLLSP